MVSLVHKPRVFEPICSHGFTNSTEPILFVHTIRPRRVKLFGFEDASLLAKDLAKLKKQTKVHTSRNHHQIEPNRTLSAEFVRRLATGPARPH